MVRKFLSILFAAFVATTVISAPASASEVVDIGGEKYILPSPDEMARLGHRACDHLKKDDRLVCDDRIGTAIYLFATAVQEANVAKLAAHVPGEEDTVRVYSARAKNTLGTAEAQLQAFKLRYGSGM